MKVKNYSIESFSNLVNRLDFAKVKFPNFKAPDLKGIQINAYSEFVKNELEFVISSFFPIRSQSGSTIIYLSGIDFDPPEISESEALEKSKSYQYSVYMRVKVVSSQSKGVEQVSEDVVFLGNLPELTSRSNYIINGIEKFIISQIVRAPGAYILPKSQIKLSTSKKRVQEGVICELLPIKGSLILFNFFKERDLKNYVRVTAKNNVGDGVFQFPFTVLMKAFGISEESILRVCGDSEYIQNTLDKEEFNYRDIILKPNSNFMKWFKSNVLNVKDFQGWLEYSQGTVYEKINGLCYEFYTKG